MKLGITLGKLAKISGGKILKGNSALLINSFSTDTRKLNKGDFFWALKGKNFDANNFIKKALEKGAAGLICSSGKIKKEELLKLNFCIEVKDTLKALHSLALAHRLKFRSPVIAITGSNGKTTTKEMLKAVLSKIGPVCSNLGNFNNEFGLPFSILEMDKTHKFSALELGSSKRGEVKELAQIARPDIAIITTIGPEHLEFFKSMENIFKTETETLPLLEKRKGVAVYNRDNPYLKRLDKLKLNRLTFGFEKGGDLKIEKKGEKFFFLFKGKANPINLKIPGEHNYLNAAAAFLAAVSCGLEPKKIIKTLENFYGVPMRMQKIKFKKSIILFDAYNANPQSMEAALRETSKNPAYYLILGDMKELGKYSRPYHKKLGQLVAQLNPKRVFLIGKEIEAAFSFLKTKTENVKYYKVPDKAKKEISAFLSKEKAVFLFKASRSMKFETLLPEGILNRVSSQNR